MRLGSIDPQEAIYWVSELVRALKERLLSLVPSGLSSYFACHEKLSIPTEWCLSSLILINDPVSPWCWCSLLNDWVTVIYFLTMHWSPKAVKLYLAHDNELRKKKNRGWSVCQNAGMSGYSAWDWPPIAFVWYLTADVEVPDALRHLKWHWRLMFKQ